MNATSKVEFGRGLYAFPLDGEGVEARFIPTDKLDIMVRVRWVGIRATERTGKYIIYFDSRPESTPEELKNLEPFGVVGKKSQYRFDSIYSFKLTNGKTLRSLIVSLVNAGGSCAER